MTQGLQAQQYIPFQLSVPGHLIQLFVSQQLTEGELSGGASPGRVVADVSRHPTMPGVFGLRNVSAADWIVRQGGGASKIIGPGKSVRLDAGTSIQICRTVVQIV